MWSCSNIFVMRNFYTGTGRGGGGINHFDCAKIRGSGDDCGGAIILIRLGQSCDFMDSFNLFARRRWQLDA